MSSDRETKPITIGDHAFVVKAYATAREAQAIQQTYFKGSKIEVVGEQPKISEFNPGIQFEVEKALVEQMVVSLDGTNDTIVDRCLDLPSETYNSLISQLDDLVAKKKK